MFSYYNDNDAFCAAWLRSLIAAGHLPPGEVDERDIREVEAGDLDGFAQAHFFAGIGGWPLALALAGWPDDRSVWTGSVPCQPLSSAGRRRGHADERHLWPAFHALVAERRPATVFGEQVASRLGREWLSGVRADLERLGYAVGAADLPAACLGAPHIRQRLWWVAEPAGFRRDWDALDDRRSRCNDETTDELRTGGGLADDGGAGLARRPEQPARQERAPAERGGDAGGVGDAARRRNMRPDEQAGLLREPEQSSQAGRMGEPEGDGWQRRSDDGDGGRRECSPGQTGASFWSGFELVPCADGKARRVGAGIQPLADGVPARMGKLRAAGNAIVPQVAAAFVRAYLNLRVSAC